MKEPISLIKVAVVASSVLLVSGFVAYWAGALEWMKPGQPPLEPSQSASASTDSQASPAAAPIIMSGSKYMTVSILPESTEGKPNQDTSWQPSAPPPAKTATLMGGSKSKQIVDPPPINPEQLKAIMFGSKSAPVVIPPAPEPQPQQPKP